MTISTKGKKRAVIDDVQPCVDGGSYPAKRTVGEIVKVTADIFADGHDHLRAFILYKKPNSPKWNSIEMNPIMNDQWEGIFPIEMRGEYIFMVEAWVDHFLSWYEGFKKKAEVGQKLSVELLEGINFLKRLSKGENNIQRSKLINLAKSLGDENSYPKSIHKVLNSSFQKIVKQNPLRENITKYRELKIIAENKRTDFTTWYELFPRSASTKKGKHGTFKDCEKLLGRISAMGFDVLYFPPIHPIGKINRKGKNNAVKAEKGDVGSPWAIGNVEGGHKAIHPRLGTLKDFQNLVIKAKKLGIDVAMDLAFQCAPDHPYVKKHPEWFWWRPDGSVQYAENPPKKYQDILPINFESEGWESLWLELKSIVIYWIKKGIKIFRVDNPHTKPTQFWEWLIVEIQLKYPDIIFLAEAFTRPKVMANLAKVGFTQSYTYFTWRNTKSEIIEYMTELTETGLRNFFRPNFWPNTPDILPFYLQQNNENAFISRLVLAATLSSNYGIYGPVYEFYHNTPIPDKEEYLNSEKYEIKYHTWKQTNRIIDIISLINRARKENPALQDTWNIRFCNIDNEQIITYLKSTSDLSNIIMVVVNLDAHYKQSGYIQLPLDFLRIRNNINIKLLDQVTGDRFTWTEEWNYIELDPHELPFHLFKLELKESNL